VNNNFAFSTDFIGMNYRYPDGSYAEQELVGANIDTTEGTHVEFGKPSSRS
jgi:hypothetical protein